MHRHFRRSQLPIGLAVAVAAAVPAAARRRPRIHTSPPPPPSDVAAPTPAAMRWASGAPLRRGDRARRLVVKRSRTRACTAARRRRSRPPGRCAQIGSSYALRRERPARASTARASPPRPCAARASRSPTRASPRRAPGPRSRAARSAPATSCSSAPPAPGPRTSGSRRAATPSCRPRPRRDGALDLRCVLGRGLRRRPARRDAPALTRADAPRRNGDTPTRASPDAGDARVTRSTASIVLMLRAPERRRPNT